MNEYFKSKTEYAYHLAQAGRFFRKARALVVKDGKLLVLRVDYKNGDYEYLFPGGGVDEGESAREAAAREAEEEYSVKVRATHCLGREYYNVPMQFEGKNFVSRRVEYFYICEYLGQSDRSQFGLEGEFDYDDRKTSRTALSLDEIRQTPHKKLGHMSEKNYQKLLAFIENQSEQ